MIEQSVSLTSNGVVKVPGYEQLVRFGYTKNRGVCRLAVTATGEWEGLTIRCFWHVPDGKDPASSLVADGYVAVPASVTAQPGNGCVVFEGTDGSKTVTSADLRYRVSANFGTEDGTMPEPDSPAWEKFVGEVKSDADAAEQAKQDSEAAAENASQSAQQAANSLQELKDGIASGDFKGEKGDTGPQGPKGDTGPAVALDTTLTHEGEAADAKATGDAISAVKARQNILVGTETGNPIAVDDAFATPLCGLSVYGRSTQNGTPTPDAPVPIVSAGDGGSVAVRVTGANVLEGTAPGGRLDVLGVSYTVNENGILVTGTATGTSSLYLHRDSTLRLTRGVYYLTTKGLSTSIVLNFFYVGKLTSDMQNQQVILTKDVEYSLVLQPQIGATANTTVQVSLTRNKTTTYSPYREQLLTLPTPTGLPGIPVTSGGNYIDSNGQQWVCDEVDLERGVKVQRVDKAAFDSTKTLSEQNAILATPIETPLTPAEIAAYKALTAYGPDTVVQAGDGAGIKLDYQRDVNIAIKKLEDAIASMTTT